MKKIIDKSILLFFCWIIFEPSAFAYSPDAFVIKVNTRNNGTSHDDQFSIPVNHVYGYNYDIDCGDGDDEANNVTGSYTCTYVTGGTYNISITGLFPAIYFKNDNDKEKIMEVVQWGTGKWQSMNRAFYGASNLTVTASDNPDLSDVSNMYAMFKSATGLTFTHSINDWDVSSVSNMEGMFEDAGTFNQDIGDWNVSTVSNMSHMFYDASVFNKNIGNWDVSSVTNMSKMFKDASAFNQDIENWNVSNVSNMEEMFSGAWSFNQDIGKWNVSNVTNMIGMFSYTGKFNQNIGNWDVSRVTNMYGMFQDAYTFNQDIGNWNVSHVSNMTFMFSGAEVFNQDIGSWDVSSVMSMYYMFWNAKAFNQDIGDWNLKDIYFSGDLYGMFIDGHLSISNYDNLLKGWSRSDLVDNVTFEAGTSSYCNAEEEHSKIEAEEGWLFHDYGKNCDFYINTPNEVSVKSAQKDVLSVSTNYVEDPYDPSVHYYISGGTDRDKFTMNTYGKLEFRDAPDANKPTDKNGDNIYRVQVKAVNEGYTTDYQTIKVKVEPSSIEALVPVITYLLF